MSGADFWAVLFDGQVIEAGKLALGYGADELEKFQSQPLKRTAEILRVMAPAATLFAGAFTIFQGLRFAEKRLHNRLEKYLWLEEKRLAKQRSTVTSALREPGATTTLSDVLLSAPNLSRAVKKIARSGSFAGTEAKIDRSLDRLKRRHHLRGIQDKLHRQQSSLGHLIKGANFAEKASEMTGDQRSDYDKWAATEFVKSLQFVPDDLEARYFLAHQYRRLANKERSTKQFKELEQRALALQDRRMQAEAKKGIALNEDSIRARQKLIESAIELLPEGTNSVVFADFLLIASSFRVEQRHVLKAGELLDNAEKLLELERGKNADNLRGFAQKLRVKIDQIRSSGTADSDEGSEPLPAVKYAV